MAVELGEVQMQFARLIWEKEPVGSGELVKLCAEEFGWKKSTTYTVLKNFARRVYFKMRMASSHPKSHRKNFIRERAKSL